MSPREEQHSWGNTVDFSKRHPAAARNPVPPPLQSRPQPQGLIGFVIRKSEGLVKNETQATDVLLAIVLLGILGALLNWFLR